MEELYIVFIGGVLCGVCLGVAICLKVMGSQRIYKDNTPEKVIEKVITCIVCLGNKHKKRNCKYCQGKGYITLREYCLIKAEEEALGGKR